MSAGSFAYRGVWISFLEWEGVDFSSAQAFRRQFGAMAEECRALGLNTLTVHLRPFSDALYKSRLFPASHLLTGTQGRPVAYDPLEHMLEIAQGLGLGLTGWINPYRITSPARRFPLCPEHPAVRWLREDRGKPQRRVIPWGGGLYYNPASEAARSLIAEGVADLLARYPLDGVQIDDSFYPTTAPRFDAGDWQAETDPAGLGDWRREQVNRLVRGLYHAVHSTRPGALFCISPQGVPEANFAGQYSDVERWLREPGYGDMLLPQLYFGFHDHSPEIAPRFGPMAVRWASLPRHGGMRLLGGLPAYQIGMGDGTPDREEFQQGGMLSRMALALAQEPAYTGISLFRYDSLFAADGLGDLRKREREALWGVLPHGSTKLLKGR